jgi:TM2 domain containing protein
VSDPLNPTPADAAAQPYAPEGAGAASYAPQQDAYGASAQAQQPYAPEGVGASSAAVQPYAPEGAGTASALPQQDAFAAPGQPQQPQFAQPGANQYAQYGQAPQGAPQGMPQGAYGQPQQGYGQPQGAYGQPMYGQPMYAPSAGKDFSYVQICSFVAIGVSVFSWLLFQLFLSVPTMIGAIILHVKAKREGAPQNFVNISKIAMIVTIVMSSLQLLLGVLFVVFAVMSDL